MRRLYVETCSSNRLVQFAIARQLRAAAESELVKSAGKDVVDVLDLMHDVEEAFDALSTLLGEHDWFFGQEKPGLFDASLFSYSHLILDEQLGWTFNPLKDALERHGNLVRHSKRVWEKFF
jgi:metaxin